MHTLLLEGITTREGGEVFGLCASKEVRYTFLMTTTQSSMRCDLLLSEGGEVCLGWEVKCV